MKDSDSDTFHLFGTLRDYDSSAIIRWIRENNETKKFDRLKLLINCIGGQCADAYAIIDAMRLSKIPVDTIAIGICASSAFCIFIHGCRRFAYTNTNFMTHRARFSNNWIRDKFLKFTLGGLDYTDMFKKSIMEQSCGRVNLKKANKLLKFKLTYIKPTEMTRMGLCDTII